MEEELDLPYFNSKDVVDDVVEWTFI